MAWVAGADVTTGDLITSAQWNNYLGATGSIEYLKTEADKLDDVTQNIPANADDTIYQNSTKIRIITIKSRCVAGDDHRLDVGVGSPPATAVASAKKSAGAGYADLSITAVILPSYYYRLVTVSGTPTVLNWVEWDLH